MRLRSSPLVVLFALCALAAVSAPREYPPSFPGARVETYKQVQGTRLRVYIFEPSTPGTNRPAIVFFFGGGWVSGSPAQFEPQSRHFAQRGMVAICADYRVGSRHQAKAADCVRDAVSCIRWVRQNAPRLGIDPQRIVAAGGSAGGHIAAATATLEGFNEPGEDLSVSSVPNGLALFNPVLMLAPVEGVDMKGFGAGLSKERLGAEPQQLSPIHHVKPGTPPTLVQHGKADTTVPYVTAEAFAAAMKKAGSRCDLIGYAGQQHGFFNAGRNGDRFYKETLEGTDRFLVSLGYLAPQPESGRPTARAERPNILFLFADDQRADTIGALGNPIIQTPNLDRLAQRGLAFTRAYMQGGMNGATCVPSRAMLLSGRSLFHLDEKLLRDETWPAAFGRAGYTTFISGKWHNGESSIPRSFQVARSIFAGGMTDPMQAHLSDLEEGKLTPPKLASKHACEVFADEAIRFLREHRGSPFFCYIPFDAPHDPHIVPDSFPVRYEPKELPLPPNFLPQHPWDNGDMVLRDERLLPWPRPPGQVRSMLADYYRYVSFLDAQIGRVLNALDASPFASNTIVVFAADSGVARGDHGLIGKQNLYEGSVRVPLIIAGPGIAPGRTEALCYLFDVLPTLGKRCGVSRPATSEGNDLNPVLSNPRAPGRQQLLLAYKECQRAIRDDRWKLIRYPLVDQTQLFDLQTDPYETNNLAQAADRRDQATAMLTALRHLQTEFGDHTPLEVADPNKGPWTPPDGAASPKAKKKAAANKRGSK